MSFRPRYLPFPKISPAEARASDLRKYAPIKNKVYEGTPFFVHMFTSPPPEFIGNRSYRPKRYFEFIPAVKMRSTSIEVPDTATTRVIVAALTDITEFNESEIMSRIQTKFKQMYPEEDLNAPPRNIGIMPNYVYAIQPYIEKLAELDQHERLARAREAKALEIRESELKGLFGGKKHRNRSRSSKKSKKQMVRRWRMSRKHK